MNGEDWDKNIKDRNERRDLALQLFASELWRIKEKYENKEEFSENNGLKTLEGIYREVVLICNDMIDHYDEGYLY